MKVRRSELRYATRRVSRWRETWVDVETLQYPASGDKQASNLKHVSTTVISTDVTRLRARSRFNRSWP